MMLLGSVGLVIVYFTLPCMNEIVVYAEFGRPYT